MRKGIYVYCFSEGAVTEPIDIPGIEGAAEVYGIGYKNITAVVSDVFQKTYEPSRTNALAHEKVLQVLMQGHNLIPCSFCNIFKSKNDLLLFMNKAYTYLMANLDNLRGKEEAGLRVFWKTTAFLKEMQTKKLVALRESIKKNGQANSTLGVVELGRLVEERVNERRQYYKEMIYDPLAGYADDARLNEVTAPRMVLNAAFLVKKEKEHDFDLLVEDILSKYLMDLEVSYTGPWPPYNFVTESVR